jgi:RNA polymerase sigma factor (sigma-70 family)
MSAEQELDRKALAALTDKTRPLGERGAALAHLYGRHRPALVARVRRFYRGTCRHLVDQAEDVVQEVFTKLPARAPSFKRDRPLWPWLNRLTRNAAIDLLRKWRDCNLVSTWDFPDRGPRPDEGLLFEDLLALLTPEQRRVFTRYHDERQDKDAIARAEGWARADGTPHVGRVSQSLHDSYLRLRACWGPSFLLARATSQLRRALARVPGWSLSPFEGLLHSLRTADLGAAGPSLVRQACRDLRSLRQEVGTRGRLTSEQALERLRALVEAFQIGLARPSPCAGPLA